MPFQRPIGVKEDRNQTPPSFIRPLKDKRALIGQNIVLECQIEAHPDPVIKWLKDGHNVSQCPDYQLSQEGKWYRLRIPSAQGADCGRFTVQAMNAAGIKQSTCMLIVAPAPTPVPGGGMSIASSPAPPQTPVGPSTPFFLKELKHQPLRPNAAAVLEGRVVGVPVPQIEWLKGGQPLSNYRAKTEYDPQTGICMLTIPQMFAEDVGEYLCRATNAMGQAESSAQIMPQEQFDRWFSDEQRQVTRDRKQRQMAHRLQQQQGHQPQGSRRTPLGLSPRATPPYIQRQLDQVQPAQHLGGFLSPSSEISESDQHAAAMQPVFRNKLRGLRLTEGTDAVLQCSVVGIPKPRIGWFKNGRPLVESHRWQSHYGGTLALLKISMMTPEDSGEYTIVAENLHGKAHCSARIEVYPLSSTPAAFDPLSPPAQPTPYQQASFAEPPHHHQRAQQQKQQQQLVAQPPQQVATRPQPQQQPAQVQPAAVVVAQSTAARDPGFRLRSPPKEQYHRQERDTAVHQGEQQPPVTAQQRQPKRAPAEQQQPQQQYYAREQPKGDEEDYWTAREQREQPPPQQQRHQQSQQPVVPQVAQPQQPHRAVPVEQPIRKQRWDFDQLLFDQFFEREPPVHPYLKPPEQVEYYLQEQLRREQRRERSRMAPPPVAQRNGPVMNGTHAPQGAPPAGGGAVKPPQFVEMPKPVSIKPGEKAVFKAKATGQPVPELTWMSISNPQRKLAAESKKFQISGGKDGQSQLTIVNVQQQDVGVYACVASNAGGSFQAQFEVGFAAAGGGAVDGQQASATKSASGGAGSARQKFQSPAPEQREQVVLKKVDRTRQFTSAKRPHLEDEEKPPSREAPKFSTQLKSQTLIEGQHAMLDLKFTPTEDPNLGIAWLLNGKPVISTQRVTILNDFGYAVLEINPVTVFDHGEYTCVAVNQLGEARQSCFVEVLSHVPHVPSAPPQQQQAAPRATLAPGKDRPNFHIEIRSQELFVGQPLHLETKLTPISDPTMKVAFYLNGNQIQSSDRVQTIYQNGFVVLHVAEANESDAGFYSIQAENEIGTAETSATVVVVPRMDSSMYLAENEAGIVDVEDMREVQSSQAAGQMHAPNFVQPPRNFNCETELGRSYFDARIAPVNDPSLRVTWLKDGQPLPNANRIQLVNNFGFVSLTIHPTYPEDAGVYSCVLINSLGQAQADAQLTTVDVAPLHEEPLHEEALPTIQSIEEYQVHIGPILQDRVEEFQSVEQPRFVRPLGGKVEVEQEQPVHFECRVQPANDVKMAVHWLFNGLPLAAGHRFKPMFDFGYVALDILYAYPEDSGTYTCVAQNELGEAQSSIELAVTGKQGLYQDPLHPEGLERIQELEQPKEFGLQEVPDRECDNPPQFLGNLQDAELPEGEDLCFEIKLVPVNDPTMQVEWLLNDQPLYTGSRIHSQIDFGFITLIVRGLIVEDTGKYTVRATNEKGSDERSCTISVQGKGVILSDPQHEQSLGKIEYLESLDKFPKQEIPDYEPTAPNFVQPLPGDIGEVEEGEPLHLECKVEPTGDNQLRVYWLRDGQPLQHANRTRMFHDFGFVSLDIFTVYSEDSGTYTCVAENALGRAETSTSFNCEPKDRLFLDTQHPTSFARIQEIEAPKPLPEEMPEPERQAPFFTKPLTASATGVAEGEGVYLEAQYGPLDDNTIVCEWLFNGQPLMKAHRFVLSQDFGFAAMTILYMYPEDSGTYTLVIRNGSGQESSSSVELSSEGKEALLLDTFHPQSVQRIEELEAPRPVPEEAPEPEKQAPQMVKQLTVTQQGEGQLAETQSLHFDAQYTPVDDNTVTVEWFHNGQPMRNSNRYRLTNDFGYAALDINFLLAEDTGEYTVVVSNAVGQAQSSASIQIEGSAVIIEDTQHPESYRRIQEIEAIRPAEPTEPELPPEAPVFTQELAGNVEGLSEGMPMHIDATIMPITDPKLYIEWYFNGAPLQFSDRIRTIHDFGYVALEFSNIRASDSGTYTCRAVNEMGQAESSISLEVETKRNLYLDSQHESSWAKIQEMEGRQAIREPSPELHFPPPTFIVPLQNFDELIEGDVVRLECRLQPVNDPTLKVYWTCNEQPLPEGNRFLPARNLDLVTLDIMTVYGEDSGLYTCRAVSDFGEAQTTASVKCQPTDALLLDTQHEQSWQQIQEMESRVPEQIVEPEPEIVTPRFVVPLPGGQPEFQEGDPIHLEGQIEPTNDNQLVVEWYFNGQPLPNGHRFRKVHDFGYVSLDILYSFSHDSGEYTCVARNALGEAQSAATLQIAPKGVLYLDPQHEQSWQRIQELEAPRPMPEEMEPPPAEAPNFIEPLQTLERIEGQPAHFQTRVTPVNDNKLSVQWFKDGQPLPDSNRFAFTNDFGLISLDFLHTVANDSGSYSVVARNEQGEASVEGSLKVEPVSGILADTLHDQSWQRIQEIEAPRPAPEEAPEVEHGPPRFTQQLNNQTELIEGQPAHFEAQVEPVADPRLRIQWFHNGRPLPSSNRFAMRYDFGLVSMDIHYVLPQDVGDYRCVAVNDHGEASTEAHLDCEKRPGLLLDVQHEESWRRIQEIEAPREPMPEPEPVQYPKPQFTQPLQSQADVPEGAVVLFEARVIPINDPSLQIQWFRNDQPLSQSNRYAIGEEFGHVWLRIAGVGLHDAGVYSCKAVNNEGAAMTNASLSVAGDERILLNSLHENSYARIQELEAMDKYVRLEYPEMEFQKPQWTRTFENVDVDTEGGTVQLTGHVEPAADPNMRIEWSLNGVPLMNANRFKQEINFGEVVLYIIHVLPHDSGVYSCRAYNEQGEATTSATVKVAGYEAIMADTMHQQSWDQIQELERPRIREEIEIVEVKEKPRFLTQLESLADISEGTPIRLEATFQPARDNDLKVTWDFNGAPMGASQLIRTRNDLGWAALDISAVNPDHAGVYTLKIANTEGEAACSASITVAGVGDILGDTQHEESWRQIQILEAPREKEPSPPPQEYPAPTFQGQISDIECNEGDPSKFEAVFVPNNDPNVQVQWVRNGVPLNHGSKYAISYDFGLCTLAIGYTYPEDEGVYQLCVQNSQGEAITSATLKCHPKDAILGDVQHEESWKRIQEIEAPKEPMPEPEPAPKVPPKFTSAVLSPGEVHEGQPAHFETTVEPIDDPELRIQWFLNGDPVASSSRLKMISDFGWVILNISDCEQRDTGEWTCVATNSAGEARASASLSVSQKERLLLDPINQSSLARIEQIEAPRPGPEEAAAPVYEAPAITAQLQAPSSLNEGDSAHLEAHYTPVSDPNLRVEWYRDGQPIYHSNRHRMVNDFGFGILDILYLLAHDSGEYTIRVVNDQGEASSSVNVEVTPGESLLLQPQSETKAKAVSDLEESLNRRPVKEELLKEERMPVFVSPLSAPSESDQGDRAHFTARYEPVDDNQLKVQWFLNNRPLLTGSRVKTINEFGVVVLEIYPVYPEDSGDYVCKAINAAGEAVTSTSLKVNPKEGIEHQTQLPQSMAGAQQKIHEIETRVPMMIEEPVKEHGAPNFVTQLPSLPQLREGALIHLDAKLEPVDDPSLKVEWFHNGEVVRNTARMKTIQDFGFVVLELCPAEPQDNGTWVCRATNAQGQAETQCQIEVVGDSGVVYEWVSPGERKERIEELEDWIGRPKADLMAPEVEFGAPSFTEQLADAGEVGETEAHSFMCVLEPIGDPTMRIEWQHNGHAVPYSNRIALSNDFGVITLMLKHLITLDTGEYTCIARNAKGEARTSASISVQSVVQVDTPTVMQPLVESIDAVEGESVHLECRVAPINDPKLSVQWLRNGLVLSDANRYSQNFEFGFVTLDILFAYPEDNGDYELVVTNDKGEARTKTHVNVTAKPGLIFSPQAPGSNVVDNLEHHLRQFTRAQLALTQDDAWQPNAQQAPVFKTELNNVGVEEGDYCRFEAQVAPINDPYMKVEWYRDAKPVDIGARFRNTLDFGYACLDLLYALPDDTGEYACVATNPYGQAMLTAKLACTGKQHVITTTQMPQGVRVKDVPKNVYWTESGQPAGPRQKQAPQFTVTPKNAQVEENMPARFECAVVANPRAKVIWYVNGVQALHGHRYKLHYDGMYYLTIMHTRISDAGTVEAVARNPEGEVSSSASLDVFQHEDFRQHKLRQGQMKTMDELAIREQQWRQETLGQLGEAFEKAPKGDFQKLAKVELSKAPIEPLETEELVQKFTRSKDEQFYDKLAYVEKPQRDFPGLELEPVDLKPGQVSRYQPVPEKLPEVKLRELQAKAPKQEPEPLPDWASGEVKLGEPVGRFTQLDEPEREPNIPARDQVRLKQAKPKPAAELPSAEHFTIAEEKAKMAQIQQGPEIEPEVMVPHKDQVQIRQKFKPKEVKPHEPGKVEGADKPLKDIPPVVKEEFEKSSVPSKKAKSAPPPVPPKKWRPHQQQADGSVASTATSGAPQRPQPTKLAQSQKTNPAVTQTLKPVQAEVGRSATFSITYSGDEPVTVKWFRDGKQLRSAFDTHIRTTPGESSLSLSKLKESSSGEYSVRLENVAGQSESSASLSVQQVPDRGVPPQFKQLVADQRGQQGQTVKLSCSISGTPRPTVTWFKDGKQLPNDERYQQADSEEETSLTIASAVPPDAGIYECVAKNPAGEVRCKSRLNMILAKTGSEAEKGPKQEAPRFADTIKPVVGQEGANAEFRAKYTGEPEPTIRWSRNNEPIKKNDRVDYGNAEGDAWLRISGLMQEDVAEYKCEAVNPVGKASTVANLVLKPSAGRVIGGKPGTLQMVGGPGKFGTGAVGATKSPQFLAALNAINARQGENVKFSADIDGEPMPTVQWQFNGKPLGAGGFHIITQDGNRVSLEIKKVTPVNAGNYTLILRNKHGASQCEAQLNVQSR